jgi:hypothetical protein
MYADQEHSGVRIGVLSTLFIGFFLAFILLNVFLGSFSEGLLADFSLGFACIGGLLLALALAAIAEFLMKRFWHSGRKVTVEEEGLRAQINEDKDIRIRWSERATAIHWYFQMSGYPKAGRERRVQSSHLCLACQVRQSGEFLLVFSFMSKNKAKKFLEEGEYFQINPGEFYQVGLYKRLRGSLERPEIPSEVLLSDKGPYWLAEQRRWTEGLELEYKDFEEFVSLVDERVQE